MSIRQYGRMITVGSNHIGQRLILARNALVGYRYTQKQIDDIMDPLEIDGSPVVGIYVSDSGKMLYKFNTVPHSSLNLVELLGIEENTKEGLDRLL